MSTAHISEDTEAVNAAALEHARKFNLIATDGSIVCIRSCGRAATLPTLLCQSCLDAHRKRGVK
jgi:hypothetical protein